MTTRCVRWLLVDDHGAGLAATLPAHIADEDERLLHVGAPALSVEEAEERVMSEQIDVVLQDLKIPLHATDSPRSGERSYGADCALRIREQSPNTHVLLYTGDLPVPESATDHVLVQQMERAGVSGIVTKDWPAAELAAAIHRVAAGERVFSPGAEGVWRACLRPARHACFELVDPLSQREHTIVKWAAMGWSDGEIAGRLDPRGTRDGVAEYVRSACIKVGVVGRGELKAWSLVHCPDLEQFRATRLVAGSL